MTSSTLTKSWWLPQATILSLPNEILLHIALHLNDSTLYKWIRTCRFFHDLFVSLLYRHDVEAHHERDFEIFMHDRREYPLTYGDFLGAGRGPPRSVKWACAKSNITTLGRAIQTGANVNSKYYPILGLAIDGDDPAPVVEFLLQQGANPNGNDDSTVWQMIARTLLSADKPPRFCPLPLIELLVSHGGRLAPAPVTQHSRAGLCAMDQWRRILSLEQVRGPRKRWSSTQARPHSVTDDFALRHDHCQHAGHCAVATTRLLLAHGADANFRRSDDTLVTLALRDRRRPVELLRCLADAGADLGQGQGMAFALPPGFQDQFLARSLPDQIPLRLAAEDAVRIQSLARYPRGRNWSVYPEVQCHRAPDVVRFLLEMGVAVDERSGRLLDLWDKGWRRWHKRPRPEAGGESGSCHDGSARDPPPAVTGKVAVV